MTCKLKLQNKALYLKNFLGVPVLKFLLEQARLTQDLKQKNNLWFENRDAVQRISGFMLCYSSKTKRTPRLSLTLKNGRKLITNDCFL